MPLSYTLVLGQAPRTNPKKPIVKNEINNRLLRLLITSKYSAIDLTYSSCSINSQSADLAKNTQAVPVIIKITIKAMKSCALASSMEKGKGKRSK